jgi:hypothetical protein
VQTLDLVDPGVWIGGVSDNIGRPLELAICDFLLLFEDFRQN